MHQTEAVPFFSYKKCLIRFSFGPLNTVLRQPNFLQESELLR